MGKHNNYSDELRMEIVSKFYNNEGSSRSLGNEYNIIYHIFNHNHVFVKDVLQIMDKVGEKIEVIENQEFKKKIKEILNSSKSELLGTLINDLDKDLNLNYDSKISLNSKHTIELLEMYGFKWPQIDKKYIMNILKLIKGE